MVHFNVTDLSKLAAFVKRCADNRKCRIKAKHDTTNTITLWLLDGPSVSGSKVTVDLTTLALKGRISYPKIFDLPCVVHGHVKVKHFVFGITTFLGSIHHLY